MTKEELKKKFEDKYNLTSSIEMFDFFWNEIQQIRSSDKERLAEEVKGLDRSINSDHNGNVLVTIKQVLSIIEQLNENKN